MSRRRRPEKREILPDPKYGDQVLSKFMNNLMLDGKKSVAERIIYQAMERIKEKTGGEPLSTFTRAIENVRPLLEVRARRVRIAMIVEIETMRSSGAGGQARATVPGRGKGVDRCAT